MVSNLHYLLLAFTLLACIAIWLWHIFGNAAGADWGGPWINRLDGFGRIYCRHYQRLHGDALKLPQSGPAIVVANHISGIDPFLLIASSKRPIRFIVASEQYHRFGLSWMFRASGCIPVDRTGKPERAFRAALQALKDGEVVGIFPHGTIHLDSEPYRRLKPGAVRLAQLAECDIYPARIDGVRAEGALFLPGLLRGHVKVESFAPLSCRDQELRMCLGEIESLLVRDRYSQYVKDL